VLSKIVQVMHGFEGYRNPHGPCSAGDGSAWLSPLRKMLNEIFQHGIKPRGIIDEQCMSGIARTFPPGRTARWIEPDRQPLPLGTG